LQGEAIAQFVRAVVELEKEQQIKASFETFFAVFDRQLIAIITVWVTIATLDFRF
jgi:hypothetical protein